MSGAPPLSLGPLSRPAPGPLLAPQDAPEPAQPTVRDAPEPAYAPSPAAPPALTIERHFGRAEGDCFEHAAVVNERTRRVHCRRCKVELDPIETIVKIAADYEAWVAIHAERRRLETEAENLRTLNATLRRERAGLSGRIKELGEAVKRLETHKKKLESKAGER